MVILPQKESQSSLFSWVICILIPPFEYYQSCRYLNWCKTVSSELCVGFLTHFLKKNTKLKKMFPIGLKAFWPGCFSEHKAFVLSSTWAQGSLTKAIMKPGLSWQIFVTVFARDTAGKQSCAVVIYHRGGKFG